MPKTPSTGRRVAVPVLLLVLGGLLIWGVSVWARDDLDVHRVTEEPAGAPALILLHGYGAPGADLVGLGETLADDLPGIQILAPEGPFNLVASGKAWYVESPREAIESRVLLAKLIDELVADGTPPGSIVVAGFSQGATMALDIGLFHPDVGCVAVLSGRPLSGVGWGAQLAQAEPPRVLVAHGRGDRNVAFSDGEALAGMLEGAGAPVTFMEHGGAHEITEEVEAHLTDFTTHCLE